MKPDPWSVVEFHARAAARGDGDERMTNQQRLMLYAAAAPEVIGARRLNALDRAEWWSAPVPGTLNTLIWSNQGELFLASPASAVIRQWVIGGGVGMLVFSVLAPEIRMWGIIPGILLGLAATLMIQRQWPAWARFGNVMHPAGAQRAMDDFVAKYERDVPALPAEPTG